MSIASLRGSSSGGGMSIGGAISGGTWGSVLYIDSSGNLTQDNTGNPTFIGFTYFPGGLRVSNGSFDSYMYANGFTAEGTYPVATMGNGQVNANSGGVYYFDAIAEAYATLAQYNYSTEVFSFGPHLTQTSSTLTTLQGVAVIKDDGTVTFYKPSTDSDANRGAALVTAMSAAVAGDKIVISAGNYTINTTLTPLDNMSIVGIGMPTITTNAFADGTPAITLQNDNITIEGLNIRSNTTGLGLHSATPTTISNLILRNLDVQPTDTDANALMFSESHGGGNTMHLITANVYNCKLYSGTSLGFGSFASLQTGSLMNYYSCDIWGATDGYLHKNSDGTQTGVTNIFGGQAYSVLDAVTSGGTGNVINAYGVFANGDQADFYGDDGTVNIYWCVAYHGPSYIVGNGINTANTSPVIGDLDITTGDITFTSFGGAADAGIERDSAAVLAITDGSTGEGDLKVKDEAYGVAWNGSLEVPTKNALYDKIQTLSGVGSFGITIDGGGSAITTGQKGYVTVPYGMTITGWDIFADQSGSIVVDVWKDTYANFPPIAGDSIAGTEKPTLSSVQKNQDTSLSTWTTTVTAGDVIAFNVDSASTVTRVTLVIYGNKT